MKTYQVSYYIILILLALTACSKEDDSPPFPFVINKPPVAFAGNDLAYDHIPDEVILAGTGRDPEGLICCYSWRLISGASTIKIIGQESSTAIIKMHEYGEYVFELKVTDKGGRVGRDIIKVTFFDPSGDPCLGCWDY